VWGSTFPVVKNATNVLDPSTLVAWRFTLAFALLAWPLLSRPRSVDGLHVLPRRHLWRDGSILGAWLVAGYATQTIGLQTTSSNRAAFITGLSVVMVPLWLALTSGRSLGFRLWGAAAFALVGIGLLSWEGGALVVGDAWALACAVTYAGYIIALERLAGRYRSVPLAAVQIAVVAAVGWVWAAMTGHATLPPPSAWWALVYLGVVATALTTLLQTIGQQRVTAPEAAIIYALEPVTASVFSFLLLGETIGARGFIGGALVVVAMILSQLPARKPEHSIAD